MKAPSMLIKFIVVILSASLFSSCANLPDLKPFADVTAEMAAGMRQGYLKTETMLARTGIESEKVKELKARWEPTKKAINAIVAYSDALAALADAGNKGEEAAGALITSLENLSTSVSALIPGIPAIPGLVVSSFKKINGVIAKLRAKKALKEAVAEADEAIIAMGDILTANFQTLSNIHASAANDVLGKIIKDNNKLIAYHKSLMAESQMVATVLTNISEYHDPNLKTVALKNLRDDDPDMNRRLAEALATLPDTASAEDKEREINSVLENRRIFWIQRGTEVRGELDRIAPEYDAYKAEEKEIEDLMRTNGLVINQSITAIQTWVDTHSKLRSALLKKQRMTVLELASVVRELIEIAKGGNS